MPLISRPWSPEEEALITEWNAMGVPLHRIAIRLRRSKTAIKTRLDNLKRQSKAGPGTKQLVGNVAKSIAPLSTERSS